MKIVLHNEVNAEDNAMLQALYSRSADSVTEHIEKLKEVGSGKFMSQYYLGYGHASIADCGNITVYIEGVSMLVAKAIQDNPLYQGQESSSRYIDWSEQPFHDPFESNESRALLNKYRRFYVEQKPVIIEHLKTVYPKKEDEKPNVYDKAITAKAFDILRGFLPCGATTNLSWSTTLRKANEHLAYLALHPLNEVRDVVTQVHAVLSKAYPNSIAALPDPSTADPYYTDIGQYYSAIGLSDKKRFYIDDHRGLKTSVVYVGNESTKLLDSQMNFINSRPKRAGFPKHDSFFEQRVKVFSKVDFGSYRDLQRHRNGRCGLPIILPEGGFHPWYFTQLPANAKIAALDLFGFIEKTLAKINSPLEEQYLLPMGICVPIRLDYDYHQLLYVAELRSSQTVHATLRPIAQAMGKYLEDRGFKTYCDYSEDTWNLRRGTQDITEKVQLQA